jgi:hypothetical protein
MTPAMNAIFTPLDFVVGNDQLNSLQRKPSPFLHGYATLKHSGAFGASGPKGGLERGVEAFLSNFRSSAQPIRKEHPPRTTDVRRRKKP